MAAQIREVNLKTTDLMSCKTVHIKIFIKMMTIYFACMNCYETEYTVLLNETKKYW